MPPFSAGPFTRRRLLAMGGLATAVVAPAAVAASGDQRGANRRPALSWSARASADMPPPDPAVHLLSRCAWGATPADLARVAQLGTVAWIEEQLDVEGIDAGEVDGPLIAGIPELSLDLAKLEVLNQHTYRVTDALNAATLYRQVYSPRRLHEAMVDFWSDHFSINQYMEGATWHKLIDDRDVIRPHALGSFKDLLTASARSVAMLIYLNNELNRSGQLNENYAREILELHTLGVAVDGQPYTEADVLEVARCFTGWAWANRNGDPHYGAFRFYADRHDQGIKQVLGQTIPAGGGERDALVVIDQLCRHPATARFLATKLVRRFVGDDPLADLSQLVDRVAEAFLVNDGDIKAMLRVLLNAPEFMASFGRHGGRLNRPMELAVRMMRVTGVPQGLLLPTLGDPKLPFHQWYSSLVGWDGFLNHMGQVPFAWLTPDGYPDQKENWTSSVVMVYRWNLGLAMAEGRVAPGFRPRLHRPADLASAAEIVDHWIRRLIGRAMLAADRDTLLAWFTNGGTLSLAQAAAQREDGLIALILDSPYFQWR